MSNCIAFDLGGTLTKLEETRDLVYLIPDGIKIFENIGRYDELLVKMQSPEYESGDASLRLLVIMFLLHNITEADITRAATERVLTTGALDLVSNLLTDGWRVFCITDAPEIYGVRITHKIGIYAHNVAGTPVPLNELRNVATAQDIALFQKLKENILAFSPTDQARLKQTLDDFFMSDLPTTAVGKLIQQIRPVSGSRKVEALKHFADKSQEPLSKWVVVGNSSKDAHMLFEVDNSGGLAIAFNADQEALSHATMSLASTNLFDLKDILTAWKKGLRKESKRIIQEKEKRKDAGDRFHFHWLAEGNKTHLNDIVKLHQQLRQQSVASALKSD